MTDSEKMTDILRSQITDELDDFRTEALDILEACVLPHWGTERHGYTHTLYGFMMRAFSYIDLISSYRDGPGSQTERMIEFMDRYFGYEREAHSVSVQLWRHKLMHTAKPRRLKDTKSGKSIYWLLQWYEQHLPRNQHFTFSDAGDQVNLNLGAIYLIEDIQRAAAGYLDELDQSTDLQRTAAAMEGELTSYELRHL